MAVQKPSPLIRSFGIDPSTTRMNGPSSPRSAWWKAAMKASPTSVASTLLCRCTLGRPGTRPSSTSSMLGSVAAVTDTVSPSQLSPSEVHRMCTSSSAVDVVMAQPPDRPLQVMLHHLSVAHIPLRTRPQTPSPNMTQGEHSVAHRVITCACMTRRGRADTRSDRSSPDRGGSSCATGSSPESPGLSSACAACTSGRRTTLSVT